jgi:4-amino-4-deoxy-L-arabinose transferase-like glycosyltransferase
VTAMVKIPEQATSASVDAVPGSPGRWHPPALVTICAVLEGVAAVFLLHRTVRRWAGEHVALLAALVFAFTPVTVAINRDTNPDTLMVLLLVAGAYAFTRSVQRPLEPARATRWLLLAAVFLDLGFVTKMLQAWIVVPAFAVAYLLGSPASVRRPLLDVLGAGVMLLASSLWWVTLVSAWPGPKPYIGGSTDGSVLNLVVGYNGLGRIFGRNVGRELVDGSGGPGGGPWSGGRGGHGGVGGSPGITRLFGEQIDGQISWLLPLCLLVLVAVAIAGIRQMWSRLPPEPARRAGWFLWGGWLLLVGLVLSYAQGGFHSYYTTEMAPALAAVTAAGVAVMGRHYRQPGGYRWVLLPAVVTLTVLWAWVLVSRDTSWNGWLCYAVVAVGALAVVLLVAGRLFSARVAGVLGVVALLLAPGVWSSATAFASSGGALAQAGPQGRARGGLPARFPGRHARRHDRRPAHYPGLRPGQLWWHADHPGRCGRGERRRGLPHPQ